MIAIPILHLHALRFGIDAVMCLAFATQGGRLIIVNIQQKNIESSSL